MNYKIINIVLGVFWLVASIAIVVLDLKGVVSLSSNNLLFFGFIIIMFISFQIVKYFKKKQIKINSEKQ